MSLLCKESVVDYLKSQGGHDVVSLIESGQFDYTDYEGQARNFEGWQIKNSYCDGLFGQSCDMQQSLILKVDAITDTSNPYIEVVALTIDGAFLEAYFMGEHYDWKTVYDSLVAWTS